MDSQYVWHDDDPADDDAISTDGEEMKDVEMHESETDNVFLSLIQDFGKKRLKETWVTVGTILRMHRIPRTAHPSLALPLDTQFIVVLKGIGADTYQCLKNDLEESDDSESNLLQSRTRRYLKELTSARVDYVDKKQEKCIAGMQNIPLVYGDSMLGSKEWVKYRSELEGRRREEALGRSLEAMDEVELS